MVAGAKPKRDIVCHGEYQGVHRQRQVDIAKKLFGAMGIARDDKPMRQDWVLRGFRQFDAPVSLVLAYDRVLDPGAVCHFDLGALCYGIVLAAWDRGLGSVINGQGIMRSDIVREVAGIPEDQAIMTCVAMGYPDDSFPPMACDRTARTKTSSSAMSASRLGRRDPKFAKTTPCKVEQPGSAAHHHRASKTRVNALMLRRSIRGNERSSRHVSALPCGPRPRPRPCRRHR